MSSLTGAMVLGFAFDRSGDRVLLIRKTRPDWMAGKLNGIGGKVEPSETYLDAMVREFREETGLETTVDYWRVIGMLHGSGWTVALFATDRVAIDYAKRVTGETPEIAEVGSLAARNDIVPNLAWLVPLARDPYVRQALVIES